MGSPAETQRRNDLAPPQSPPKLPPAGVQPPAGIPHGGCLPSGPFFSLKVRGHTGGRTGPRWAVQAPGVRRPEVQCAPGVSFFGESVGSVP